MSCGGGGGRAQAKEPIHNSGRWAPGAGSLLPGARLVNLAAWNAPGRGPDMGTLPAVALEERAAKARGVSCLGRVLNERPLSLVKDRTHVVVFRDRGVVLASNSKPH